MVYISTKTIISYLDVTVEADSRVICALQALKGNRTLLFIVDEEDEDPASEVQQNSYRGSFADAAIRPARSNTGISQSLHTSLLNHSMLLLF